MNLKIKEKIVTIVWDLIGSRLSKWLLLRKINKEAEKLLIKQPLEDSGFPQYYDDGLVNKLAVCEYKDLIKLQESIGHDNLRAFKDKILVNGFKGKDEENK